MIRLILACALALAATASVIAPTQAASLTIQSDDDDQYLPDDQSDNGEIIVRRHHYRQNYDQYGDYQNGDVQYGDDYSGEHPRYHRYHRYQRCHVELVRHWRHHHRVIEQVRVCT
ncbi:hypothetical protein NKJ26_11825 [Mesorhizobium sp. M0152]|uniref:hypothetical protein n=1 Tax=Mesorhizobium sp. M0152 TaxID=2956898 RepID=UPI0033353602